MKTSLKKALSIFTAIAVMLTCITISSVSVSAGVYEIGARVASGNCGAVGSETSVTWELTKNGEVDGNDTYTITIKGNGAMADYEREGCPWYRRVRFRRLFRVPVTVCLLRWCRKLSHRCHRMRQVWE